MGTKIENAAKREAIVAKMGVKLQAWSTQLDGLVAGYLEAGATEHDPYRLRIDDLRRRHGVAQEALNGYTAKADPTGTWGAFRAAIKNDWDALNEGFKDLTH